MWNYRLPNQNLTQSCISQSESVFFFWSSCIYYAIYLTFKLIGFKLNGYLDDLKTLLKF